MRPPKPETPRFPASANILIFIPGIAASDLYLGNQQVWPTINPFTLPALRDMSSAIQALDVTRSFSPLGIGVDRVPIYQPLLDFLVNDLGYVEYRIRDSFGIAHPNRLTSIGFDTSQTSATLFLFPYDWRHSNEVAARNLQDYITGIQKIHPNAPITLVAHSMGGLVARRYITSYRSGQNVSRVFTIGSPFLGTPVAIYRMFRGDFYSIGPVDAYQNAEIKTLLARFPGFFELLPSARYFEVAPSLPPILYECSEDLNGNGMENDAYTARMLSGFLDAARPDGHPGAHNDSFHAGQQDDWHLDAPGIRYAHVVGLQRGSETGVGVRVSRNRLTNSREFEVIGGCGDGTVAFWSAYRSPRLWAPATECLVMRGWGTTFVTGAGYHDSEVEHTGLTANPRVHSALRTFLEGQSIAFGVGDPVDPLDPCSHADSQLCPKPFLSSFRLQANGEVAFDLSSSSAQVFRIETSEDLIHWTLIRRETNNAAPATVRDRPPTGRPARYYRAIPE